MRIRRLLCTATKEVRSLSEAWRVQGSFSPTLVVRGVDFAHREAYLAQQDLLDDHSTIQQLLI